MALDLLTDRQPGGFSFENCRRNDFLQKKGMTIPKAIKTGTTICGVVFKGYVGAALILGGVDYSGPHLYTIAPHGSTTKLPYVTMGSGSLAAMTVLESRFKSDMSQADAVKLVRDAICAGIFNDLGSGSNVDVCIITKGETKYIRPYDVVNEKGRRAKYNPAAGSTTVLSRRIQKVEFDVVTTRVIRDLPDPNVEAMDTS